MRPAANPRFRAKGTSARRVADVPVYRKAHPAPRFSSPRVPTSHGPSRFRAGTPLRRWGTLVKSRAKSPIFAPAAPLVAGGFRELTHPPAGLKFHPLRFFTESLAESETLGLGGTTYQNQPTGTNYRFQFPNRNHLVSPAKTQ